MLVATRQLRISPVSRHAARVDTLQRLPNRRCCGKPVFRMSSEPREDVTRLLQSASAGDARAAADLLPLLYDELRRLAAARMAKVAPGQTLQATALVHEAYLRLIGTEDPGWENRGHFFFAAARAIRDILVEQARKRASLKRGGDRVRVDGQDPSAESPLNFVVAAETAPDDIITLTEALEQLEKDDPQAHRIVMLRFFSGLTHEQTAEVLGVSERTVRREWSYIRARLHRHISSDGTKPER